MSGLGGTWASLGGLPTTGQRDYWFVCTDRTTSAAATIALSGTFTGGSTLYHLRPGAGEDWTILTDHDTAENTAGGSAQTGPTQTGELGMILLAIGQGGNPTTLADGAGTWTHSVNSSGIDAAVVIPGGASSSYRVDLSCPASGGTIGISQVVLGTATAVPPNAPTGLIATPSPDGTELQLDWTAATGAPTGYDVRIDGGSPTDVGNVLTHDFTGLTPGTSYTLEVRAYNAAGDSSWASITASTTAPPGTPTGLVETVLSPTSVELDWTASTGSPDGYEVRVDGGTATDIGNVLTHTFTGLYPGSSPLLEVRAYNEAGFSAWASVEPDTPPVTEAEYTAVIELGDHSWTIVSGECEDEEVVVLDGLRIAWNVDESKPWPAQPNPVECSLSVWVEDVADFADVGIGTPLSVVLTDVADNVFGTFHGRISSEGSVARNRGPAGLGMLYSLSAVDYTVDLAETPVTITAEWPAEDADTRVARVFTAIAGAGLTMGSPPSGFGSAAFEALSAGTTTAAALLEDHLSQLAVDSGNGLTRYIMVPVAPDAFGGLKYFEAVLLDRTVDAALLPGTLDVVDGVLVLTFPDLDADGVVDACAVDLNVPWTRLKFRAVNVVTVAGGTVTASAAHGGPPVRLTLGTTLTDQTAAERMAALYLPDLDEANGWVANTFRLYAHREPGAIVPAWFPDHRTDPPDTDVYVMPLALVGIPPNINLSSDLDAYSGQLVRSELLIERKKLNVDFGLRRQIPGSVGADALTWDDVASLWPSLTWDDVDPALSWYDARLGKAP